MIALGPQFVLDTLDLQCVRLKDTGVVTIDINSVIMVLRMLGFQTSISEQSELTTWLANNNCIYRGPDAVDTHIILVDREKLLNALDNFK